MYIYSSKLGTKFQFSIKFYSQHFIAVIFAFPQFLFRDVYSRSVCWIFARSCTENCSKSGWKINGGNITKRRRQETSRVMDKMNEGSDASAFVKTDVKFWITRERERKRKGLLTSVQFLREIMRSSREGTSEERSLNIKGTKGQKIIGLNLNNYINTPSRIIICRPTQIYNLQDFDFGKNIFLTPSYPI